MKRTVSIIACVLGLTFASATSAGRPDKSWKSWFGHISGGYVIGQGDFGDIHDDDFQLAGGATWWTPDSPVGLDLDLAFTELDLSRQAIDFINDQLGPDDGNIDGGETRMWSLTTNAIWSPDTNGSVSFYVTGGVGLYRLESKIKSTGLVYYPPICDPWYWWCYPGGVGPGTIVEGKNTETEWGWNAGVGLNFEMGSGSQLFVEAKYHSIQTDFTSEYVPILVGFRW